MKKIEDKETRYFIDIDLKTRNIIGWDYDQRCKLADYESAEPSHHRVYITKGQYNKLEKEYQEI